MEMQVKVTPERRSRPLDQSRDPMEALSGKPGCQVKCITSTCTDYILQNRNAHSYFACFHPRIQILKKRKKKFIYHFLWHNIWLVSSLSVCFLDCGRNAET